jgi:hypothetical protein
MILLIIGEHTRYTSMDQEQKEELRESIWQSHKEEENHLIKQIEEAHRTLQQLQKKPSEDAREKLQQLQKKYSDFELRITQEVDNALLFKPRPVKFVVQDVLPIKPKVTCSICKVEGHNKRSCTQPK